jgi:hypothetical protein
MKLRRFTTLYLIIFQELCHLKAYEVTNNDSSIHQHLSAKIIFLNIPNFNLKLYLDINFKAVFHS